MVLSIDKIFICAIALHETLYIDEWIQYHKLLGFDGIQLYDNSKEFELKKLSKKYPDFLNVTHLPGELPQEKAYDDCAHSKSKSITSTGEKEKAKHWGAFIDIDEFIVLKSHTTIKNLIEDYYVNYNVKCLGLNWLLFGSNGHKHYSSEPVIKRFTKCEKEPVVVLKSICQLAAIKDFTKSHYPNLKEEKYVKHDMGGNIYQEKTSEHAYNFPAVINHYHTKSYEEFKKKVLRGRASRAKSRRDHHYNLDHQWTMRDLNEATDATAWIDYNNRLRIIANISMTPDEIVQKLSKACNGNRHCNIAKAAKKL
jgi:hypothetical protein